MQILGLDIGGTGIKGAPVEIATGKLMAARFRLPTPEGAKPGALAKVVAKVARHFDWQAPIGCGFPAIITDGKALTAANVHQQWIGTDVARLFASATSCPVSVINDADAAGLAEMQFGAGKGETGVVLLITIGTGLGSALFEGGKLVPNTELGHIEIDCEDAESNASDAARKRQHLSWKKWAGRLNKYLATLEGLLSPDLIILGGGAVKSQERFMPYLKTRARLVIAQMGNEAGIVGAALAARHLTEEA